MTIEKLKKQIIKKETKYLEYLQTFQTFHMQYEYACIHK